MGSPSSVTARWIGGRRRVPPAAAALGQRAVRRGHLALLRAFGRLPVRVRRMIARRVGVGFTVGALVLVEQAGGERVLLIRPSYRRGWGLPGGLLQRGEEPAAAARREVREEIGIVLDGLSGGAVVFDVLARRIDVVYRGRVEDSSEPRPVSAEVREVAWFARDELPLLLPEARSALTALDRQGEGLLVLRPDEDSGWLT